MVISTSVRGLVTRVRETEISASEPCTTCARISVLVEPLDQPVYNLTKGFDSGYKQLNVSIISLWIHDY